MARLAVIPGNTLADLAEKGLGQRLGTYFNPGSFFEEVVFLSPFEQQAGDISGMPVVPCKDVQLPLKLEERQADLVRAYGAGTPADMAIFHRAANVPVIVSVHDKRPEKISAVLRLADIVFAVSEELRSILTEKYGVSPKRIFVVPNGVDGSLMRPLQREAEGLLEKRFPFKKRLLHVGRKSPEKNIEAIIRVLVSLGPEYGLVSVGQGDPCVYQAMAREMGVAHRCVFLEGLPQSELVRFYNWADCVCHPSRSEAMCNVLLEALACGCAVVATETAATGLGDAPMKAMLLVRDPDDIAALEKQLRLACEDGAQREALLRTARSSVEHLFLERTRVMETEAYRRVLEMKKAGIFRRHAMQDLFLNGVGIQRRIMRKIGGR